MVFRPRLDFKRKREFPPRPERFFVAALVVAGVVTANIYLMVRVAEGSAEKEISGFSYAFSSHSFYDPDVDPQLAFDGDLNTAWVDYPPPESLQGTDSQGRLDSATPPEGRLYIQKENGKTHFPGATPAVHLPETLVVHAGASKEEIPFYHYARPRQIRLVFFYQDVVDVDREYRFPGPPQKVAEKFKTLPDTARSIPIPLDFLPNPGPSPGFPENIFTIYYRMEILSVYPGKLYPERVAIREISLIHPEAPEK